MSPPDRLVVTMDNREARFTPNGEPIRFLSEIPGAHEWSDALFRQRDEAIAAREVQRLRIQELEREVAALRARLRERGTG